MKASLNLQPKKQGNLNQQFESEIRSSQRQSSFEPAAQGEAKCDALPAWQKVMKVQSSDSNLDWVMNLLAHKHSWIVKGCLWAHSKQKQ